jgi:hypothetical protein
MKTSRDALMDAARHYEGCLAKFREFVERIVKLSIPTLSFEDQPKGDENQVRFTFLGDHFVSVRSSTSLKPGEPSR